MNTVYWIRQKGTNDINKGYIGITCRSINERFKEHKVRGGNKHLKNAFEKYDDIEVIPVVTGLSREDAITVERHLRPKDFIGWNQTKGGGDPPRNGKGNPFMKGNQLRKGAKDSLETRAKKSKSNGRYVRTEKWKKQAGQNLKFFRAPISCLNCRKIVKGKGALREQSKSAKFFTHIL